MRIYLAGLASGLQYLVTLLRRNGDFMISNGFISFHYVMICGTTILPTLQAIVGSIVVDSGAHSFFSEAGDGELSASVVKKQVKSHLTPDEHFEKYIAWLQDNQDIYDYFVELDIGELVGQKKVAQWRERLRVKGLYDRCITVYHPKVMTMEDYITDLDHSESRYVALEGDRRTRSRLGYMPLIKLAYERGVKVHGFALVKNSILNKYPFYSVDSSSWKSGVRFGTLPLWKGDHLQHISLKEGSTFREVAMQLAVNGEALGDMMETKHAKHAVDRLRCAVVAYRQMEDYYTQLWKARGIDWEEVINK